MELKDYQIQVLDYLDSYLDELENQFAEKLDYYDFQVSKGKSAISPENSDYCQLAWEGIKATKAVYSSSYTARLDATDRNIPNICFKIPTGGGKTLLATCSIQRINQDYYKRNTGFVLWMVPSETIYTQTLKTLRNKEHPYRAMLDRASGGKTIILEKNDSFTKQDTEDNLCVMLLMLQSSNRKGKEFLKMFRDSGRFGSFFPEIDDYNGNNTLLGKISNLETADLGEDGPNVIQGLSIKHSLGNVMRMLRPVVIIDEGHRATSKLAQETLESLNPRFILELSATPKPNSNVLINIGGTQLKQEQMIKLPINVFSYTQPDWKNTLNNAHEKLKELNQYSGKLQENEGRYLRPIMVIKAERKKKNNDYDHVEDIKKYLIDNLDVNAEQIRIKLSEKDEIANEDLQDKLCPVKYIITKDALKEGWDCPFAYVLAILTSSKDKDGLTQLIGRVLRQPEATETSIPQLNQCYVYCDNSDVDDVAQVIKSGLESEGLGDIADQVTSDIGTSDDKDKIKAKRRKEFTNDKILIPKLNSLDNGKPRSFDYHRDILANINWQEYKFINFDRLNLADKNVRDYFAAQVDYKTNQFEMDLTAIVKQSEIITAEIDTSLMARQLMDKLPNPFISISVIEQVVSKLQEKHDNEKIALNGPFIVDEIKKDCLAWVMNKSEAIFKDKLQKGQIFLQLLASPNLDLNWKMAQEINLNCRPNENASSSLDKNIFQPQFTSNYNGLEKEVGVAINKSEAVKWWHRLGIKGTEYAVQGWRRGNIYPDFLLKIEGGNIPKFYFLETKGNHLKNEDTEYKQKVFDYLNKYANQKPAGEFSFINSKDEVKYDLVFEDDWQSSLNKLLA